MFSWIFILDQNPRRGYFLLIVPVSALLTSHLRSSDAGNALISAQLAVSCLGQELSVIVAY